MSSPGSSRPTSPSPSEQAPQVSFRVQATPYRFAFERQRGPASVISDANESRADFTVTELNTASQDVYSSLELPDARNYTFAPSWSSSRHGFNAISTVLNNPNRSQAPLKSSRAPLPVAISPDLPRVRRKDFDTYVNAITPAWEQFSRHTPQRTASSSLMVHASIKGKTREIPPLSTVPAIFFDPSFDLRNPRTFASVTEQNDPSTSSRQSLNPDDISLNQVLQEKLSHYMDVVEQHLTREVQTRSTSFFAALSNLQDLQTEGADCLDRISSLRRRLRGVDSNIARRGLQTIKLQKKLSNLRTVEQATTALKELTEMLSMCDRLIGEANWDEALALLALLEDISYPQSYLTIGSENDRGPSLQNGGISHTESGVPSLRPPAVPGERAAATWPKKRHSTVSVAQEPSQLRQMTYSISSLSALSSLPDRISIARSRISSSLRSSIVDLLRSDLIDRFEMSASSNSIASENNKLRQRLIPLWQGLLKTGGTSQMLHAYHDMVLSSVRSCVRKRLPQKTDADDDADLDSAKNMSERTALLSQELRSLTHSDYLILSRALYAGLLNLLEGVAEHSNLFNDKELQEIKISDALRTANQQALEAVLPEVLPTATELANTRLSKVVMVRSEQHASLALSEFLVLFNEGWAFVVKCEIMARKMIVGLRGVMVSQAKAFLTSLHNVRLSASATLVENEQWAQVEVPAASQRWADLLVEAAVGNPSEFILQQPEPQFHSNGENGTTSPPLTTDSTKQLLVEGRPYFVVGATLKVIEMLLDYLKVLVNLSLLTTDAMSRTIEYLKAFNSRTCQVVLGAGAMRSAGLKNITAKHLALASQSLSAMTALIPYVRETFRRHLNPKQAVMLIEFDKLKRDYHEHQNEIHSKLIAIMGDRLAFHCKALHSINWEDTQQAESPNMYMRVLMKETLTLHKVLSKYLATQAVEFIMSQVFAAINHRLSEEYAKIDLPSQEAKDRLLKDARFLRQELSGLKDINMSNTMLETVVQEKSVRRKSPFTARRASAMLSSSPTGDNASSSMLSVAHSDRTPRTSIIGPEGSSTSLLLSSKAATTADTTPGSNAEVELAPPRLVDIPGKSANGGYREAIDTEGPAEKEEESAPVPPAKDSPAPRPGTDVSVPLHG